MYKLDFLLLLGVGAISNAGHVSSAPRSAKPDTELDESAKMAVLQHLGLADDGKQGARQPRTSYLLGDLGASSCMLLSRYLGPSSWLSI